MNEPKDLVLDANILIREVFGSQIERLLKIHEEVVAFYSPEICFVDAGRRITAIAARGNVDLAASLLRLDRLEQIVRVVYRSDYEALETTASDRIRSRDISDWPIVATCLLLDAPLWTEDRDFFGCGIATWTTNNVELYLKSA